ncbi:MAG TPA: gluconeogenesis factor YvcK family protein [Chloroflexota bacterium]|nr:gluconeogenesis factor YvcK family protein [Chloroflexota bacterium]
MTIPAWMAPGSTIKRWLVVFGFGMLVILLGIDYILLALYRQYPFPSWASPYIYDVTLQWIDHTLRGALFLSVGILAIVLALRHLNRVIVAVIPQTNGKASSPKISVIGAVAQHKLLQRGPRITAIGGGTGMSLLLHGLRTYSRNLTVVVTVADDGGSSGRLRRELRILPPGDFRQCIAALADVEDMMVELLQYRFKKGSGLEGHSFGNLFIAAMADITGSFEGALEASNSVLAVRGKILPSTLQDVTLAASLRDQSTVEGESVVAKGKSPIDRVFLLPEAPEANAKAITEIREADVIVIGPGSLYTSIMPNLLVPGIAQAIEESKASLKVFVCNVATEPGETDDFTAWDFVTAIESHVGRQLFDVVITNSNYRAEKPGVWKSQVVRPGTPITGRDIQVIEHDVVDTHNALRHDAQKLSQVLLELYDGRRRTPERPAGWRVS